MTTLVMFDDAVADGWEPFALTRPCGELRFGRWTLRERLERAAGSAVSAHVTRPWLTAFVEADAPPVAAAADIAPGAMLWCSRAVPGQGVDFGEGRANLWIEDRLAGIRTGAEDQPPDVSWYAAPAPLAGAPNVSVGGAWLEHAWDLVSKGPDRLARDLGATIDPGDTSATPAGCWKLGRAPIALGEGVHVEPGVLFDARKGAIELGPGVEVRTGARLSGPLYAGASSRLLGGSISSFSGGPFSYVRGEIEEVTTLGYANKAHDGFLGHAVLGRWVNLGAMTTNSDLKNNYGTIRMGAPDGQIDTGLTKLGCLLGDHAKTAIGVLLNTGTIVGAGANLFGDGMPPKWVPPFSWGGGERTYRRDDFVSTAETVVGRRGVAVDDGFRRWLRDVWDEANGA